MEKENKPNLEFLVTLWPTFPHFERFAKDERLSGIRLNSAMVNADELNEELKTAKDLEDKVPLYFDIKGRQLRVMETYPYKTHLELTLNHPIDVETPTMVLFKAGADHALLKEVRDKRHLIFEGGPEYMVYSGESLHIRDPSLKVHGPVFLDYEIEKIKKAREAGFDRFFLSYLHEPSDIAQFREHVGDSYIIGKIEDKKGLEYVANKFKKTDNFSLMAARGDMFVELGRPHQILKAMKLIIKKDPQAYVGSRLLLSLVDGPVPSCADLSDMAWLYDIGYRRMMLCDELCLKEELMARAVNVFEAFKKSYTRTLIAKDSGTRKESEKRKETKDIEFPMVTFIK